MKKLLPLFLIFLILPFVFAVEVEIKEQYSQGETFLAKVSGNFISPLIKDNIFFYKEHVRIPMIYDIQRAEDNYYIYALLTGKSEGNYSLSIENAQYKKGEAIIEEGIKKNFSITNQTADFSVNPGFVFPSEDFSLSITNLQDKKISVSIKTNQNDSSERKIFILPDVSESTSIDLTSGQKEKIDFKFSTGEATTKKIILESNNTSYEIPVVLLTALEGIKESTFSLEPSKFTYALSTNSEVKKTVYLYNTGNTEMNNISIWLSDSLKSVANVSISKIEKLNAGENKQFELIFYSNSENAVEGELKAKTGETIAYSSISLNFISDYIPPVTNQTTPIVIGQSSTRTCAELQGTLCNKEGFACNKEMIQATDGYCCKGTCSNVPKNSSVGRIIAIIIVLGIMGTVVWFYFKKYKKAKNPVDLLAIAKGKDTPKI